MSDEKEVEVTAPADVGDLLELLGSEFAETPVAEAPRRFVSDVELQDELTRIANGVFIQQRFAITGEVTDVFVSGGSFAPGRSRWLQTNGYDPVEKQAAELAASLQ